jgi:hypothetical protein
MSENDSVTTAKSYLRTAARLRKLGVLALLLGALGAGFVYWKGRHEAKVLDDPTMGGFNKANQRQMELMYGKMGTVTEDLIQSLKRPGTQAALIAIGGVLVSAGCFYFARLLSYGNDAQKEG